MLPFRILSQEEFDRLSIKERIEYLRLGIAEVEKLKDETQAQVLSDLASQLRTIPGLPAVKKGE